MSLAGAPAPRGGGYRQGSKRGHYSSRVPNSDSNVALPALESTMDPIEAERLASLHAKYPKEFDYLKSLAAQLPTPWKDEDLLAVLEDCLGDEEKAADRLLNVSSEEGFQWTDVRKIKKEVVLGRKESSSGFGNTAIAGAGREKNSSNGKGVPRARASSESRGGSRGGRGGSIRGESRGGSARIPKGSNGSSKPFPKDSAKNSNGIVEESEKTNAPTEWGSDAIKSTEDGWAKVAAGKPLEDGWTKTLVDDGWSKPAVEEQVQKSLPDDRSTSIQPSQAVPTLTQEAKPVSKPVSKKTWSQIVKAPEPVAPVQPPKPAQSSESSKPIVNAEKASAPSPVPVEIPADPSPVPEAPKSPVREPAAEVVEEPAAVEEPVVEETPAPVPVEEPIVEAVASPPVQNTILQPERKSPIGTLPAVKPAPAVAVSLPPRQVTPIRRVPTKQDPAVVMPSGLGAIGLRFGSITIGGEDIATSFGSESASSEEQSTPQSGAVIKPIDQITGTGAAAALTPIIGASSIASPSITQQANEIAAPVQQQTAVASSPIPTSVQPSVVSTQSSLQSPLQNIQSQPVSQPVASQPAQTHIQSSISQQPQQTVVQQSQQPVTQQSTPAVAVLPTTPAAMAPTPSAAAAGFGIYPSYQTPVAPYNMGMPGVSDYLYGGAAAPDAIRGQQGMVGANFPPGMPIKPYYDPYQQQSGVAASFMQPRLASDGSKFASQDQQSVSQFHQPGLTSSSHPQQAAVAPQHQHQHQPQGPTAFPPTVPPVPMGGYYGPYYQGYAYPQNPYSAYGASQAPPGYGYGPHPVTMGKFTYPNSSTTGGKPTPGGNYYPNPNGGQNTAYVASGTPQAGQGQPASPAGQGLYDDGSSSASSVHGSGLGGIHHVGVSSSTSGATSNAGDYGKQSIYPSGSGVSGANGSNQVNSGSFPFGMNANGGNNTKSQEGYKSQLQGYDVHKQGYNSMSAAGAGVVPSSYYNQQSGPQPGASMPSSSGYQGPYHQGVPSHVLPHGGAGSYNRTGYWQ